MNVSTIVNFVRSLLVLVVLATACGAETGGEVLARDPAGEGSPVETGIEESLDTALGPIGGGVASGTGLDVPLECPDGAKEDSTEWFGPAGLSMDEAVTAGVGDLQAATGKIRERVLLVEEEDWATWQLGLEDGTVVAVLTVARTRDGWDPSHATFCVIPQPQPPPPPFTLHVSNQSFEDPTVWITVTIDGTVIVDEPFEVQGQHTWKTFVPDLPPGEHSVRAESDTGAVYEDAFTLVEDEPLWAVLNYWWHPEDPPRYFSWSIRDEPVYFA